VTKALNTSFKIILPNALKDQVLDQLLKHPEWVGPFTTHRVEGHGDPDSIASPAEQVRGRAERVLIEILMDNSHVDELLQNLRNALPSPDVFWWLSPVTASGSFA